MGRKPIGKTAMTSAERVRRYRLKHGADKPVTEPVTKSVTEPVTKPGADDFILKQRIAGLEAEIARLNAAARRDQTRIKELEQRAPAHAEQDLATGKAMDETAYKLVRQLSDNLDHVVLKAARKLASTYDLTTLATALEADAKRRRERDRPPEVDYAKVEVVIAAYVEGKTSVTYSAVWGAILEAMRELRHVSGAKASYAVGQTIPGYLARLGFHPKKKGQKTFVRASQ